MSPFFKSGRFSNNFPNKNIKEKDVIVFEKSGDYFVKRVTDMKEDSTSPRLRGASKYFLEGDNKKKVLIAENLDGLIEKI